jgi:hypothetical protein
MTCPVYEDPGQGRVFCLRGDWTKATLCCFQCCHPEESPFVEWENFRWDEGAQKLRELNQQDEQETCAEQHNWELNGEIFQEEANQS